MWRCCRHGRWWRRGRAVPVSAATAAAATGSARVCPPRAPTATPLDETSWGRRGGGRRYSLPFPTCNGCMRCDATETCRHRLSDRGAEGGQSHGGGVGDGGGGGGHNDGGGRCRPTVWGGGTPTPPSRPPCGSTYRIPVGRACGCDGGRPLRSLDGLPCRWLPAGDVDAVSHPVGRPPRWGGGRMGGRHGGAAARRRLLCAVAHLARGASPSCSTAGVGARRAQLPRSPLRPGGSDGRDGQQQLDARGILRGWRRRRLFYGHSRAPVLQLNRPRCVAQPRYAVQIHWFSMATSLRVNPSFDAKVLVALRLPESCGGRVSCWPSETQAPIRAGCRPHGGAAVRVAVRLPALGILWRRLAVVHGGRLLCRQEMCNLTVAEQTAFARWAPWGCRQ